MTFKGTVKNGKIKLRDTEAFVRKRAELEGEEVRLELEKWYKKRSGAQNRYYWGVVIDILSEHTGYTPDEMHRYLKKKHLPKEKIFDENVLMSTTNLTTADFEEYMKKIRMWASSELKCYIPEPNEAPGGFAYKPTQSML